MGLLWFHCEVGHSTTTCTAQAMLAAQSASCPVVRSTVYQVQRGQALVHPIVREQLYSFIVQMSDVPHTAQMSGMWRHVDSAHLMPGDCGSASSSFACPACAGGPSCPGGRPKRVSIRWFRLALAVVGVATAVATGAEVGVAGCEENSFSCRETRRQVAPTRWCVAVATAQCLHTY